MKRIYLDYNSTTPLTANARERLVSTLESFGNPSSVHAEGRVAKAIIQKARREIAALVVADPANIVFTSGATEAIMTLLTPHYFIGRSPLFMSHLYFSATEHPCVTSRGRFPVQMSTVVPVDRNGVVQPDCLREILRKHDRSKGLPLVAIQYANHETGIIQPITALSKIVKEAAGLFIVDVVQAVAREKLDMTKKCGDFFLLSAHKIGGPKGIGAFIATGETIRPEPLLTGGGQEKGLRAGTEAVSLIASFGAAAASCVIQCLHEGERLVNLQKKLEEGLKEILPSILIYGSGTMRLPNTTFFSAPGIKAESMQIAFDLAGIAVSAGAACSSGKIDSSPVLQAMGIANSNGAIRVSTGQNTRLSDIKQFLKVFETIIARTKQSHLKYS
ncbi:MAG: cysteine desulfurase [Candidatus Tokpelaia sp. JSC085]|nr:MAG: cysteine desulfurase [Candidatus Tokpelaia sp. JSC085]